MNARLFICVAMGVAVAHLGVFMILYHLQPAPPPPPKPNFIVHSQTVVDRQTGEKTIYREITVSTRLPTTPPAPVAPPVLADPREAVKARAK